MSPKFHKLILAALLSVSIASPALAINTQTWTKNVTTPNNITITGTGGLTISGSGGLTVPAGNITAAEIQSGSAKRQVMHAQLSPLTGAAANTTVYRQTLYFGRAGTVKLIKYATHIDPVSGTNTFKALKATPTGTTMLNAASISLNGTTIDTATVAPLTATGGDLALTAGQGVYLEVSTGTQGAALQDVEATVEFEPTNF